MPVPSESPKRPHPLALLILIAVCFGLLWIIFKIISSIFQTVEEGYGAVYIPRGEIPEGVFWTSYALYAGAVLFLYGWLTAEKDYSRLQKLRIVGIGVAVTVAPLIILLIPLRGNANESAYDDSIECGSWLISTADTWIESQQCLPQYNSVSRTALTVGAAGIAAPFLLVAYQEYHARRTKSKPDP